MPTECNDGQIVYAQTEWIPDDVNVLVKDWPLSKCEAFLNEIEEELERRMYDEGWNILHQLIAEKLTEEEEYKNDQAQNR